MSLLKQTECVSCPRETNPKAYSGRAWCDTAPWGPTGANGVRTVSDTNLFRFHSCAADESSPSLSADGGRSATRCGHAWRTTSLVSAQEPEKREANKCESRAPLPRCRSMAWVARYLFWKGLVSLRAMLLGFPRSCYEVWSVSPHTFVKCLAGIGVARSPGENAASCSQIKWALLFLMLFLW